MNLIAIKVNKAKQYKVFKNYNNYLKVCIIFFFCYSVFKSITSQNILRLNYLCITFILVIYNQGSRDKIFFTKIKTKKNEISNVAFKSS